MSFCFLVSLEVLIDIFILDVFGAIEGCTDVMERFSMVYVLHPSLLVPAPLIG